MKTVKQVSRLTGISVRTLQYYDEIGLLKPTRVTEAGYRLYDADALLVLQQILFFKELDFSLKDIKLIMQNPNYEKMTAFRKQKELLELKRERLNGLLELLDKLIKGENCMSFKEFDMSDYFSALDAFRVTHADEIIKFWGNIEEFDKMTEKLKSKESEIAQIAIRQYGSIEKYTEAMKKNLDNFSETMGNLDDMKDKAAEYKRRSDAILLKLTADLSKDISSDEIKAYVHELVAICNESNSGFDMGENYWDFLAEGYLTNSAVIEVIDNSFGKGASEYIGSALKLYASKT